MQLRYDEHFIEAAVFLAARGRRAGPSWPGESGPTSGQFSVAYATQTCPGPNRLQIARFHREREKLYDLLDPDERDAAFARLHLDWFREWRLDRPVKSILDEFPLVLDRLDVVAVRATTRRNEEGAELYVNAAGQRTGLIALRPERVMDGCSLRTYLRHEFMHLQDMVDPAFGYSPALELPGLNAAQRRVAHERYRLLWDITIDGRLAAAGWVPVMPREQHANAFVSAFPFWGPPKQAAEFDSLWSGRVRSHAGLLALIEDPRGLREAHRPAPGAPCPLCEFPTFDWADAALLPPFVVERIATEFPAWSVERGLCDRCREAYEVLVQVPGAGSRSSEEACHAR